MPRSRTHCVLAAIFFLGVSLAAANEGFVLTTDQFDQFLTEQPADEYAVAADSVESRPRSQRPAAQSNRVRIDLGQTMYRDEMVQPAQARSRQNRSGTVRSASRSSRSRTPFMIGDSPFGLPSQQMGFGVDGLDLGHVNHPVFGGNRFNAAEAGSFLPQDRVFFTYRHMHNANTTNFLGFQETNDVEKFVVGFEKTLCDGMISAELRVPLLRQLDSDVFLSAGGPADAYFGDRSGEFGNMAANFKILLAQQRRFAIGAGLAVNIPTAEDVAISQYYDTTINISQSPLVDGVADFTLHGWFKNDTVSLVPYLAWAVQPSSRCFHQGFLQIDAPLNSSGARVDSDGTITPGPGYDATGFTTSDSGEFFHQTLLRLNANFGYWLTRGRRNGMPSGLAALFEVHYTTALDDPSGFSAPITTIVDGSNINPDIPVDATVGAGTGDYDVVNISSGFAVDLGTCVITNGVIVPVTRSERFFDFEYNLQVNKRF